MKSIFEKVISRGGYDLNGLTKRINEYHISGHLTDNEREELLALARGDATPGMDLKAEVQKLWAAIRELQGNTDVPADVAEFRQPTGAHDAYFKGDRVTYGGKTYACVAPDGVACVWAPDVMPGYWEAL